MVQGHQVGLEFGNVYFKYEGSSNYSLENINMGKAFSLYNFRRIYPIYHLIFEYLLKVYTFRIYKMGNTFILILSL